MIATSPLQFLRNRPTDTLSILGNPHRNSFGFLRWTMAGMVIIDHSFPLGGFHGGSDPTWVFSRAQDSLGGIAVAGFFLISGFLVRVSQSRSKGAIQFLWKRFLRIFPGFWICLLVTAFFFAPLAWLHERGALTTAFLHGPYNPFRYVEKNALLHMHQYGIDGLLTTTPFGRLSGGAFDGSLWTLLYEFKCYLLLAALGFVGVVWLRRLLIPLTGAFYLLALAFQINLAWAMKLVQPFNDIYIARFGFLFFLGATLATFAEDIPLDDRLGVLAIAVAVGSLHWGLWIAVGYPAFAYALLWLSARLPMRWWDRMGDMSYGLYIYAFPAQMLLADHHMQKHGLGAFVISSFILASIPALISWHVIEKRALALKRIGWPKRGASRSPRGEETPLTEEDRLLPAGYALQREPLVRSGERDASADLNP